MAGSTTLLAIALGAVEIQRFSMIVSTLWRASVFIHRTAAT
jgi:hypothetical protein